MNALKTLQKIEHPHPLGWQVIPPPDLWTIEKSLARLTLASDKMAQLLEQMRETIDRMEKRR